MEQVYSRPTASVSAQARGSGAAFGTRTPAAPVDTATLSVMPASLAALGSSVVGGGWRGEERREKRLTASELQQRLLAEVDYLDEMHDAEHELLSMLQVSQTLPPSLFSPPTSLPPSAVFVCVSRLRVCACIMHVRV